MRTFAAGITALALTQACTTTEMVRGGGDRTDYTSVEQPADVGGCFARNIERDRGMIAAVRSAGGGKTEVIVRAGPEHVFAVAEIAPAPSGGSIAHVWLKSGWFLKREQFIPAMVTGC